MKIKSIVSSIISLALVFSVTAGSVSASDSVPETTPLIKTQELTTSDGISMGYVTTSTSVEYNNKKEGVEFTVTVKSDYSLNEEFSSIKEYRDAFSDGTDVNTYLVTKDNELYANGELLEIPSFSLMSDTGGIPEISHYYSNSNLTSYTFRSYSDIYVDWTLDLRPTGSHVAKTASINNPKLFMAKSSIDSFENNFDSYVFGVKATLILAGVTSISWVTLLTLATAATTTGIQAAATINSYNSAKSAVNDAYYYINQL